MAKIVPHLVYIINDSDFFVSHRLIHAKFAISKGWKVSLICPKDQSNEAIRQAGVHLISWQLVQTSTNPIKEIQSFFELKRLMKNSNADLFHSITIKANFYAGVIARLFFKTPIIFAISGFGSMFGDREQKNSFKAYGIQKIYQFILAKKNAHVIVQNKIDNKTIKAICNIEKCHLIKGVGVDLTSVKHFKKKPYPKVKIQFAMISRLIEEKGVIDYLKAANEVIKKYHNVYFYLWGFFYQKQNVLSISSIEPFLHERIVFKGFCTNTLETLKKIDILVHPTYYNEGLPKILIDASACACGIITTNMPGCLEIVENQRSSLVIEPKSSSQLVSKMVELIENQSLIEKLGKNAQKKAFAEFDVNKISNTIFQLQQQLINLEQR